MNNLNLTRQELEKAVKDKGLEVYSEAQMRNFISSNEDILKSGSTTEELDELQKSEYDTMVAELRSFSAVDVYDQEGLTITKSTVYVRPKQVEWDEQSIEKSEDGEEIEKARSGVYTDTALNRKLGRVGQKYGNKKQSSDKLGDVPWESTSFGSSAGGGYQLTFNSKDGKKTVKVEGKDVEKLMSGSKEEKQAIKKKYYSQKPEEKKEGEFSKKEINILSNAKLDGLLNTREGDVVDKLEEGEKLNNEEIKILRTALSDL
jgi:hypothetical protein